MVFYETASIVGKFITANHGDDKLTVLWKKTNLLSSEKLAIRIKTILKANLNFIHIVVDILLEDPLGKWGQMITRVT